MTIFFLKCHVSPEHYNHGFPQLLLSNICILSCLFFRKIIEGCLLPGFEQMIRVQILAEVTLFCTDALGKGRKPSLLLPKLIIKQQNILLLVSYTCCLIKARQHSLYFLLLGLVINNFCLSILFVKILQLSYKNGNYL